MDTWLPFDYQLIFFRFKPLLITSQNVTNFFCIKRAFNCIWSLLIITQCFQRYYLFYFLLEMHQSSNKYFPSITNCFLKWISMIVLTKIGPSNAIFCLPFNLVLDLFCPFKPPLIRCLPKCNKVLFLHKRRLQLPLVSS